MQLAGGSVYLAGLSRTAKILQENCGQKEVKKVAPGESVRWGAEPASCVHAVGGRQLQPATLWALLSRAPAPSHSPGANTQVYKRKKWPKDWEGGKGRFSINCLTFKKNDQLDICTQFFTHHPCNKGSTFPYSFDVGLNHVTSFKQRNISKWDASKDFKCVCVICLTSWTYAIHLDNKVPWCNVFQVSLRVYVNKKFEAPL